MNQVEAYERLAGVYDEIVVDPCYPVWADFLESRWRHDPAGVADVLDVCCGTGLMAAELIERGYTITGSDASAAMLARARALLGPVPVLIQAHLPDVGTDHIFDAAISTFDGWNYVPPSAFEQSLVTIGRRLRPGGWFIFDVHTDAMMRFTLANPVVTGEADGNHFTIESQVDPADRTCLTSITISQARSGEPFTERHEQFFHSDEQVAAALKAGGFTAVATTDEYTDRSVGPETLRATWLARRE